MEVLLFFPGDTKRRRVETRRMRAAFSPPSSDIIHNESSAELFLSAGETVFWRGRREGKEKRAIGWIMKGSLYWALFWGGSLCDCVSARLIAQRSRGGNGKGGIRLAAVTVG